MIKKVQIILLIIFLGLIFPTSLLGEDNSEEISANQEAQSMKIETIYDDQGIEEALRQIDENLVEQGGIPFLHSWFQQLRSGQIPFNFETIKALIGEYFCSSCTCRQAGWDSFWFWE